MFRFEMNARYVALVVTFVALTSVSSAFAHMIAWVGHPTIGAILVTFLYLTVYGITDKLGIMSIVGLLTGTLNSFMFALPLSVPVHLARGAIFDLFFLTSHHKLCCKKCAIAAGMLSFYGTMVVIFMLYTLFGLPFVSWWIWFIIVGIPSTLLTMPGSLLALRYKQTLRKVFVRGGV
jgi:hypothetical protein